MYSCNQDIKDKIPFYLAIYHYQYLSLKLKLMNFFPPNCCQAHYFKAYICVKIHIYI